MDARGPITVVLGVAIAACSGSEGPARSVAPTVSVARSPGGSTGQDQALLAMYRDCSTVIDAITASMDRLRGAEVHEYEIRDAEKKTWAFAAVIEGERTKLGSLQVKTKELGAMMDQYLQLAAEAAVEAKGLAEATTQLMKASIALESDVTPALLDEMKAAERKTDAAQERVTDTFVKEEQLFDQMTKFCRDKRAE